MTSQETATMFFSRTAVDSASRRRRSGARRASFRPAPEGLEDRVVLNGGQFFVWTGAVSNAWSNPGNWSTAQVPPSGFTSSLIFPANASNQNMINDLDGPTFGQLVFQAGGYSISGDSFNTVSITNESGTNTIVVPLTVVSSGANIAGATGSVLNINAPLNVSEFGAMINTPDDGDYPVDGGGSVNLNGVVSGVGGITTEGLGSVYLAAANTYLGGTNMDGAGVVFVGTNTSLGTGPVNLGLMAATAPVTLSNNYTTSPGGSALQGANPITLTGSGVLQGPFTTNPSTSGPNHVLSGALSGSGSIQAFGGSLLLSGANTYTGGTTVQFGSLTLGNAQALGTGTLVLNGGSIRANAALTIPNRFQVNSGAIDGSNNLTLTGAGSLAGPLSVSSSATTTFSGVLSGVGGLEMVPGAGTVVVNGVNTTSGRNLVAFGTMFVNGTLGSGPVFVAGTLAGTGNVGLITLLGPGTISPGSPGATGTLRSTGPVNFGPEGVFAVALSVSSNENQFFFQSGQTSLAGATLKATLAGPVPVGSVFQIIGSVNGTLSGTFNGLPDNGVVSIGGQPFQIVYADGLVQLTAISGDQALARFDFAPYRSLLKTGPVLTTADVTGDGVLDVIYARATKKGPFVVVADARTGRPSRTIRIATPFRQGKVRVAVGDVNGDGTPDFIAATGGKNRPLLSVHDGRDGRLLRRFRSN